MWLKAAVTAGPFGKEHVKRERCIFSTGKTWVVKLRFTRLLEENPLNLLSYPQKNNEDGLKLFWQKYVPTP
jgi:hypothetical protein